MKAKKVPMRRCVGCMVSKPKKELVRIVAAEGGGARIDPTGKANGRGVYLCPDPACFALAKKKKALTRGLETDIPEEQMAQILEELTAHANKNP